MGKFLQTLVKACASSLARNNLQTPVKVCASSLARNNQQSFNLIGSLFQQESLHMNLEKAQRLKILVTSSPKCTCTSSMLAFFSPFFIHGGPFEHLSAAIWWRKGQPCSSCHFITGPRAMTKNSHLHQLDSLGFWVCYVCISVTNWNESIAKAKPVVVWAKTPFWALDQKRCSISPHNHLMIMHVM